MRHARPLLAALVAIPCCLVVAVAAQAGKSAPTLLLPDLVQEEPTDISIAPLASGGIGWQLGFRSAVHNEGTGPLVVEGKRSSTKIDRMVATQVIKRSERARSIRRRAVATKRYVSSPDHRHWHVLRFETYELRGVDNPDIRVDHKTGFCLGDRFDIDQLSSRPFEPVSAVYRGQCGLDRPELTAVRQGISVGYGDEYHGHIEGQSIDITGLPAGRYDLIHRVNAHRKLLELNYANNVSCLGVVLDYREDGAPFVVPAPCHLPPSSR